MEKYNSRKTGWVLLAAFVAMAVTLSCSLATRIFSKGAQALGANATQGRIAYVGTDGNIYTIDRDGKQRTPITQDANLQAGSGQVGRIYQYPTWSPDGQKLAFMGFSGQSKSGMSQSKLYTASADGKRRVEAFSSQDAFPFYLFWSPNSQYLTFLSNASGGNGLALYLAAAAGGNSKVIGTGQPLYWDWSPDNQAIITHTGGATSDNPDAHVSLLKLDGTVQKKELDLKPGSFQAPAWSPGGDEWVVTSENSAGVEELVLAGREGAVKKVLASGLSGQVAFAWAPKGSSMAYTNTVEGDTTGLLRRLILLDPKQPEKSKKIAQGVVVAFFWSPDGRKIAYFQISVESPGGAAQAIAQTNPGVTLEVQVYDLDKGKTERVASFQPTDAFEQVLPFFDQYQRSGTVWSPDSKSLVFAGVDKSEGPGIYVVGANGGPSQKIADGDLAFWSWK